MCITDNDRSIEDISPSLLPKIEAPTRYISGRDKVPNIAEGSLTKNSELPSIREKLRIE
jgi:hypothetical protein